MGFSLILRAFFSFPNERQFIECQFFWKFRIIRQNNKMPQIVENLLHLSGIEQKEHPCEALFLDEVLSQCIEEQEVLFEQRNLEIKKSIQPNLAVQGNPKLLGELFSNLLSNAAKYASAESVMVELARQEQSCVFRITNQTMQNWIPIRSGCYSM